MKKIIGTILVLIMTIGTVSTVFANDYEVKTGDVLWKIARDHNLSVQEIAEINSIENVDLIYPGQVLKVTNEEKENGKENDTNRIVEEIELKPGRNTVKYLSGGEVIVAHLFIPNDYVQGEKRAAIVVTPPATGVKEQTAGLYAEKMSNNGFITLAFDPRGWGESEGLKSVLDPYKIAEDVRSSVDFISSLDQVDANNLFNLGICMGSGFAAYETAYDSRIKALGVVSPDVDQAAVFLEQVGSEFFRQNVLPMLDAAKAHYLETGENLMRKQVPETEEEIQTATAQGIGMREYYLPGMPGYVPNWRNEQSLLGTDKVFSFSIFNHTHMFDAVPTYVVYGDAAVTANGAIRFYEEVQGPKDKLVFEGAEHFDLYWMSEYVEPAVEGIVTFFNGYIE